MDERLQIIGDELADIRKSMTEFATYWGANGGDGLHEANTLSEIAFAIGSLALVVHGLAQSSHGAKLGGGSDD